MPSGVGGNCAAAKDTNREMAMAKHHRNTIVRMEVDGRIGTIILVTKMETIADAENDGHSPCDHLVLYTALVPVAFAARAAMSFAMSKHRWLKRRVAKSFWTILWLNMCSSRAKSRGDMGHFGFLRYSQ